MNGKTRYHYNISYINDPRGFGELRLYQLGRRYCEEGATIEPHPHREWYELTVVRGGSATVITNGEPCTVKSGDIYLSFPYEVHEIRADGGGNLDYDFLAFYPADGELKRDLDKIRENYHGGLSRVFSDEKIASLLGYAISEFSSKDAPYSEQVVTDILRLITTYLIRDFNNITSAPTEVSEAEILCYKIMNYVDTHIYTVSGVSELAEKFNYNYRYLSGFFKRTTGKNLSEYLRVRRLETAKAMILEDKKRINEIAELFGYTPYSFSKAFKAHYGVSPKNIRK